MVDAITALIGPGKARTAAVEDHEPRNIASTNCLNRKPERCSDRAVTRLGKDGQRAGAIGKRLGRNNRRG